MAKSVIRGAVAIAATMAGLAGGVLAAAPAGAAQSEDHITCGGQAYTIRVNNSHSGDMGGWSVAHIVDMKGHLIPAAFSGDLIDNTRNDLLVFHFESVKGAGHANHQQTLVPCTLTDTGTLGDFFEGGPLPDGTAADDAVTFTFTALAIVK